jgi:hypothetical protein
LFNIISGLLPIVAIEEAVFLRSILLGDGIGGSVGEVMDSFWDADPLESHENGLVSFLEDGGGGAGRDFVFEGGGGGGGDHGTLGRDPERPFNRELVDDLGGKIGLESSTTRFTY